MKKILFTLLFVCIILMFCSCQKNKSHENNSIDNNYTFQTSIDANSTSIEKENQTSIESDIKSAPNQEELNFILNRNIFAFKDATPNLYTFINDIDKTICYVENWDFSKILNEKNFENVCWEIEQFNEIVDVVIFTGKSRILNDVVAISFYVQEGAQIPMLFSLLKGEEGISTIQTYLDTAMNMDAALVAFDVSTSIVIALMSEEAIVPALEYYEKMADDFNAVGDFDNAINYYKKAHVNGDKLSAAYYGKAEQCWIKGDLETAKTYFELSGNYKDSAVRLLEIFYKLGEISEENADYKGAIYNYSMAGNYSDAKQKCLECNYKQGEIYLKNNQYYEAIIYFEEATGYSDSTEKYKEVCYLYADQQLLLGNVDVAATYFAKAENYSNAPFRMKMYYYQQGDLLLAKKEYMEALDNYINAEDYSDAQTKVRQCYYEYGKVRIDLGYITDGLRYLKLSDGYADANEIIMPYTYQEAKESFDEFLEKIKYNTGYFSEELDNCYNATLLELQACNDYGDSKTLLNVAKKAKKIHEASIYSHEMIGYPQYYIQGFSVSHDSNNIIITDCISEYSYYEYPKLEITVPILGEDFKAHITKWDGFDEGDIIRNIVAIFTEEYNDEDLVKYIQNRNNWIKSSTGSTLSIYYGGYDIEIEITYVRSYSNYEMKINGKKHIN